MIEKRLKTRLPVFLTVVLIFFFFALFSGAARADVPNGCVDLDDDNQISVDECADPVNEACGADACIYGENKPAAEPRPGQLPVDQPDSKSNSRDTNQKTGGADEPLGVDLTIQKLEGIITGIACWTIGVVFAIMLLALVAAGIRFFLAQGDPTKLGVARKNLTWVIVGIAVIIGTNVIIATVAYFIGADYSFIPLVCK